MPRSSKKKKTCFSRKAIRTSKGSNKKRSKTLRKQKGGNYTTDATVIKYDGEEMKSPNTVVVATKDGKVMSVSAYQRSLNPLSPEAY
jgi:hypothetical protein